MCECVDLDDVNIDLTTPMDWFMLGIDWIGHVEKRPARERCCKAAAIKTARGNGSDMRPARGIGRI